MANYLNEKGAPATLRFGRISAGAVVDGDRLTIAIRLTIHSRLNDPSEFQVFDRGAIDTFDLQHLATDRRMPACHSVDGLHISRVIRLTADPYTINTSICRVDSPTATSSALAAPGRHSRAFLVSLVWKRTCIPEKCRVHGFVDGSAGRVKESDGMNYRIWRRRVLKLVVLATAAGIAMRIFYVRELIAALIIFSVLFACVLAVVLMVVSLDCASEAAFAWVEVHTRAFGRVARRGWSVQKDLL